MAPRPGGFSWQRDGATPRSKGYRISSQANFTRLESAVPDVGVMGGGRRSVELTPEFCERLLSMDPDEAVAELQDQGLSQAEARDVVLQLRQEAGVTAELANTLLGLPPHEAVELLMQTPGIQEGGMTAD